MPDPLQFQPLEPLGRLGPAGVGAAAPGKTDGASPSFSEVMINSLDEVKRLQDEAADGVSRLLTGESNNPDEVFSAIRKADVAFSLLMEIRNKLTEAYTELKQMGV